MAAAHNAGQRDRLVEDVVRLGAVLAPDRVRHQRDRAHPEDLGEREHDEHHGARGADAGEGRIAQLRDEVEIDDVVQRLEQHAGGDRRGHREEVARNRAVGEVLHRVLPECGDATKCRAAESGARG